MLRITPDGANPQELKPGFVVGVSSAMLARRGARATSFEDQEHSQNLDGSVRSTQGEIPGQVQISS
jgi:hypothetical protein